MAQSARDPSSTDVATPPSPATGRRRFLFALGATGAGAAAVAATPAVAAASAEVAAAPAPKASGYRVTEHIRNYYKSARR